MAETDVKPLLIKRYASRRLYNTETSDYVTLEDIAGFIRAGRDVEIIDLKSGENLTRQYLLQIIAEHESKGESVLPVNVLTDLVRSYATGMNSMVPQFLAQAFETMRAQQERLVENLSAFGGPMTGVPGFEAMQRQQEAFLKAMMGAFVPGAATGHEGPAPDAAAPRGDGAPPAQGDEIADIRAQLAALQARLARF
ncbi:MAG: polyhydroxyalkanoate synthesis repressor PhaR [Gemmobacter sp.]|jgi:polyhydroxyalkanoate synthesis repressor PhaR